MSDIPSAPRRACLLVLLDGLADRSFPELDHRTPLQAAHTPNLDRLAALGSCGHFHAYVPGAALPSEEAHFFMMGYARNEFPGRGYLEALGEGMAFADDDVLLLAHLAMYDRQGESLILRKKKPKIDEAEAAPLMAAVAAYDGPEGEVFFRRARGVSGVVGLKGKVGAAVAPWITDSDPMLPGRPLLRPLPWEGHERDPGAVHACRLLAAYLRHAHQVLSAHPVNAERVRRGLPPVNGVLTQRAGRRLPIPTLAERWGLSVLSLASSPIYRGIFLAMGAAAELVSEDPDPGRDLGRKLELALDRLDTYDLIHVHSKAPDEAAHEKDPRLKLEVIESLDRGLAGLAEQMETRPGLVVAVVGDHATPSGGELIHSGECSPLLVAGPGLWRDGVGGYDEVRCAQGALGSLRGGEMLMFLLNLLDRVKLMGLRDHPRDLPFYPGPATPLNLSEGD
jgi:2,3-bisphosphoglycerate-independent phosphoglycerate mutase